MKTDTEPPLGLLGTKKPNFDSPKRIKGTSPSLPKNLVQSFGTREEGAFAKTKAPSTRPVSRRASISIQIIIKLLYLSPTIII